MAWSYVFSEDEYVDLMDPVFTMLKELVVHGHRVEVNSLDGPLDHRGRTAITELSSARE
jgi:hypothetical protein